MTTYINISFLAFVAIFAIIGFAVELRTMRSIERMSKSNPIERTITPVSLATKDANMNGYIITTLGQGNWDYFVFKNGMFPVSNVASITALANNDFHVLLYHAPNNAQNPVVVTGLPPATTPTPNPTPLTSV